VTNSFRTWNRTGAASSMTEALFLVKRGIALASQTSPSGIVWPGLFSQTGPTCGLALSAGAACAVPNNGSTASNGDGTLFRFPGTLKTPNPNCPPVEVPRLEVPTPNPTDSPSGYPTRMPPPPTPRPTPAPITPTTAAPTIQTKAPVSSGSSFPRLPRILVFWSAVMVSTVSIL